MSEKLEEIAKAISWKTSARVDLERAFILMEQGTWWRQYLPEARAALTTLREPSEAMLLAAAPDLLGEREAAARHWRAMIDELLRN